MPRTGEDDLTGPRTAWSAEFSRPARSRRPSELRAQRAKPLAASLVRVRVLFVTVDFVTLIALVRPNSQLMPFTAPVHVPVENPAGTSIVHTLTVVTRVCPEPMRTETL